MKRRFSIASWSPEILMVVAILITVLVYFPGLGGPLMFDDLANFAPIIAWMEGDLGWQNVVWENKSGPLGRPISMASFLISASAGENFSWQLKTHNLFLHLCSALLVFCLLKLFLKQSALDSNCAKYLPVIVAVVWLVHPMFVSTVLYAVQRMAMLSTFFMLAGMVAYTAGRVQLDQGNRAKGIVLIWTAVPALTLLAALSKENGLLLPFLCGVIEWAYFRSVPPRKRPHIVQAFLLVFVLLPILFAGLYFAFRPEFILQGYDNRHFTLIERLLTQSRVLWDYIASILIPQGPRFSLYRDDYIISRGLFTPWTTVASAAGLLLLIASAIILRRKIPGYSAGIGLFFVGHSIESGVFALLIYFEHRNYLPAMGLLWALASLGFFVFSRLSGRMSHPGRLALIGVTAYFLVLSASSFARSSVWQSSESLVRQSLKYYPDSRFGRMEVANIEMNRSPPNREVALAHYRHLQEMERPSSRFLGGLGTLAAGCHLDRSVDPANVKAIFNIEIETLEADLLKALVELSDVVNTRPCEGLSASELAERIMQVTDRSSLPDHHQFIWVLRYRASRLYYNDGEIEEALRAAKRSWSAGTTEVPVAMFMVSLHMMLEEDDAARALLAEIENQISPTDYVGQGLLEEYRSRLF